MPSTVPDQPNGQDARDPERGQSPLTATSTTQLSSLKMRLRKSLRQYPDFPTKGVLFEDIFPLFRDHKLHGDLIQALELFTEGGPGQPDVIVGLDARGFLFGPSLALRMGSGFAPVRKRGKLPGPTKTASYVKEYGEDFFQIQADAVQPGQRVLILDDIIATGGSAAAAGSLVEQLGGTVIGYMFILELDFLKGREKLDAPVYTLLASQEKGLS